MQSPGKFNPLILAIGRLSIKKAKPELPIYCFFVKFLNLAALHHIQALNTCRHTHNCTNKYNTYVMYNNILQMVYKIL